MKIEGSAPIKAAPEHVWAVLMDPQALARCLPGVQALETVGDHSYRGSIEFGVGSVKGTYSGEVKLLDVQPPSHFRMAVEGKGGPGFVKGEGTLDLEPTPESTEVRYRGEAQVGGTIASVGQRLIVAASRAVIGQFFTNLEVEAQQRAAAATATPPPRRPEEYPLLARILLAALDVIDWILGTGKFRREPSQKGDRS